ATINGRLYSIGSKVIYEKQGLTPDVKEEIKRLEEKGKTIIVLAERDKVIGIIAARDEVRPEARSSLERLKGLGIASLIMLTGDNEKVAKVITEETAIGEYMAQLLPEDKVEAVKNLKKRYGMVAMVGDGVNDAPAMVTSDLGIAMGAVGVDVAIETGDIVLMSDDLSKIPYIVNLSRRVVGNIQQNITLSLFVIAFLVPMALIGWIGLVPGLLINEIGGLLVIVNGLRLLKDGSR
ncbi:MAG: HAD-IC family P-type ATPase, partial [Deltaproteobacteria bacterium]|nr:HAD-IC family P-type ATPase [Deltaproteobacteria bacterium]